MTQLQEWVSDAAESREKAFRSVVHIVLSAISKSHELQHHMVMKGGVLMAIRYSTGRHTRDIDFSTNTHYKDFEAREEEFIQRLDAAVRLSAETLHYDMACAVQSKELQPGRTGNFQTLRLTIGFAAKTNTGAMRRLASGNAPSVVKIDYSFNELLGDIDFLDIDAEGDSQVKTYSETTLLSEKLRAILQQESRGRSRKQDIYDIHFFLTRYGADPDRKARVLGLLLEKASSRGLAIDRHSMAAPEIMERSEREYHQLQQTIEGDLPDFKEAFGVVKNYYESLPWDSLIWSGAAKRLGREGEPDHLLVSIQDPDDLIQ